MQTHHSYRKRVAGGLAALALALGLGVLAGPTSPAHAQEIDVTCAGTLSTTLSPGLRNFPQEITTENSFIYAPCTSSSDAELSSGTHRSTIVGTFSCNSLGGSFADSKTIHWNTGETSTFAYHSTHNTVGGQFVTTNTGVISEGQFAGNAATEIIVGPALNLLECLFPPGITSRTSLVTLQINA